MTPILSSWKEIANYVGKAVRTAQRWERELGLPVHRPNAGSGGVVLAISEEIEAWLRSQRAKCKNAAKAPQLPHGTSVTSEFGALGAVLTAVQQTDNIAQSVNELRRNIEALRKGLEVLRSREGLQQSRRKP